MVTQATTVPVAIQDVYGKPLEQLTPKITRRQQFTEFRFLNGAEKFLALNGKILTHDPTSAPLGGPRLIIGEKPPMKVTFTELDADPRVPAPGEWYVGPDGNIYQAAAGAVFAQPYQILQRTTEQ